MKRKSIDARFLEKIHFSATTGCWLWRGARTSTGFGSFRVGKRNLGAHTWAYERWVGPLDGKRFKHKDTCPRNCVNPFHCLPPGSRVTHCKAGHAYNESNTYIQSGGAQRCRECGKGAQMRYRSWNKPLGELARAVEKLTARVEKLEKQ
jgi:hypothetical protein